MAELMAKNAVRDPCQLMQLTAPQGTQQPIETFP